MRFFILILFYILCHLIILEYVYCFNDNSSDVYLSRYKRNNIDKKFEPPWLLDDYTTSVKAIHESYILKCNAKGYPTPTIKWYFYQNEKFTEVVETDRYIINSDGSLQVNTQPTATFYCLATNILGAVKSRKFVVQKRYQIKDVKITYEPMEVYKHQKAVIRCYPNKVLLKKEYDIKYWEIKYKSGKRKLQQITKTEGRFSVIRGIWPLQLHIRNVTKDDFGEMQVRCVLENIYAPNEVIDLDTWISPKENTYHFNSRNEVSNSFCASAEVRVTKGSNLELPWCSKPTTISITWYKTNLNDKKERINFQRTKFELVSKTYGNLLINNIDISDEGLYSPTSSMYMASYPVYTVRVIVNVTVEIKPKTVSVANEQTVKLQCIVNGYPIPTISWLHNGKEMVDKKPIETTITNISQTSTISINVTIESAGVYQCFAESRDANENRVLSETQQTVPVVISEMAPKLTNQYPPLKSVETYPSGNLETDSSSFKIQCTFNSVPKPTIVWYRDDEKVPLVSAIMPNTVYKEPYTTIASLEINLRNLNSIGEKWQYGGEYRAQANNEYGNASCTTLVFVKGVYKIRDFSNANLVHGEKMSLKCYVISEAMPKIEWFRISDGYKTRLPSSHEEKVIKDGREFTLPKLDKGLHSGTYMCQSTLRTEVISKNFTISITKPPIVLMETVPDQVSLTHLSPQSSTACRPTNSPDKPWYAWWEFIHYLNNSTSIPINFNGIPGFPEIRVTYPEQIDKNENTHVNSELLKGIPEFLKSDFNSPAQIIINYNEKLHMSQVSCVVKNDAGFMRKPMLITVVNLVFEITPPSDLSVVLNESFSLNCTAKPNQLPLKTTWINGDSATQDPVNTTIDSRIYQLSNGTLVVKNIKLTDSNKFMCIIKLNSDKNEISKVVKILIKVPAEILPMNDTVELRKDSNDSLNCTIRGDTDKLVVKWYFKVNNEWDEMKNAITESKDKLTRSYIEFSGVKDGYSGEYKCEAENEYRKIPVEKIIWLNVVDVPGKISDYEKNIVKHDRSIDISWKPPIKTGNKTITGYIIKWSLSDGNQSSDETDKNYYKIINLRPFQVYNIEISAMNSVGSGEAEKFSTETLPAAPEGKVLELKANSTSSTSVTLNWIPPDKLLMNGRMKYYQICYLENNKNQSIDQLNWPPPNDTATRIFDLIKHRVKKRCISVTNLSTEKTISELLIFTEYAFRVILVNEVGYSPPAYTTARTLEDSPEGSPSQIMCTPKENLLELGWNPPPKILINGLVEGYEILYFRTDKNGEPDKIVKHVSLTTHSLQNMLPNTSYTVQVRIKNKKGLGPPSQPINCSTMEAAPEAPSNVRAYFINNTCSKIAWTPPNNSNGIVRHYSINLFQNSYFNQPIQWGMVNNSSFCYTFCELKQHSDYHVEVKASTIKDGPAIQTKILRASKGIWSFSRNIVAYNSSYIELECETMEFEAIPSKFEISWTRNEKEIDHYAISNNGSYIIHSLTEYHQGLYECSFGKDRVKYNVSLKSIHQVPWEPKIEFRTEYPNRIFLAWRSNGSPKSDDSINLFIINVYKDNTTLFKSMQISSSERSANISNLNCGSYYKIDLFAQNTYGNSKADTIYTRTRGTAPEIPNTAGLVIGNYSNSLCFNLTTFLPGQGCPANKFELKLIPGNLQKIDQKEYEKLKTVYSKEVNVTQCINVTGLHASTGYKYTIEASNEVGNTTAIGYSMTLPIASSGPPSLNITNKPPHYDGILLYVIVAAAVVVIIVSVSGLVVMMHCCRETNKRHLQNNIINNNINENIVQSPQSLSTNRNRKLPTPPSSNVYDKGIPETSKATNNDEEDEMLMPYATYESIPKSDPNTSRERPNRTASYITGSQAHSYQYPDMLQAENASGSKPLYENELKQPLLNHTLKPATRQYDQGYSRGTLPTLRPQIVRSDAQAAIRKPRGQTVLSVAPGPSESEAYRPSSSLCSSTTESSTKEELREVFRHQFCNQFSSRLPETDEDGASTARGGNRSTLINRSGHINTMSDDSILPESYCESGSSGDDCGIRNFTQDPPGQQVIAPTIIRQFNPRNSSMSYDTANRRPLIQQSNNFTLQQPRNQLPEEDEDESNNYTNNFVLV